VVRAIELGEEGEVGDWSLPSNVFLPSVSRSVSQSRSPSVAPSVTPSVSPYVSPSVSLSHSSQKPTQAIASDKEKKLKPPDLAEKLIRVVVPDFVMPEDQGDGAREEAAALAAASGG